MKGFAVVEFLNLNGCIHRIQNWIADCSDGDRDTRGVRDR